MKRALLLEGIHTDAKQILESAGWEVSLLPNALQGEELVRALAGVSYVGIRSKSQLNTEVLNAATDLEGIGAFCIGTNQIDLDMATEKGIPVFNAPNGNTQSVIELGIGYIIALARGIADKSQAAHSGNWQKTAIGSVEIKGKTLGVIGYGGIGSRLGELAEAMGMAVIFCDLEKKEPLGSARQVGSIVELLEAADFVSIHVDGRPGNKSLIGKAELQKMKQGSFMINLSRGSVVDLDALKELLLSGHVVGAALDVFPQEPGSRGADFVSCLQNVPNVILTPHIGGSTQEAQKRIAKMVTERLLAHAESGETSGSVNMM